MQRDASRQISAGQDACESDYVAPSTPAALPGLTECVSSGQTDPLFSKIGKHGGPRANSGGARPGSGPKPRPQGYVNTTTGPRWYCLQIDPRYDIALRIELEARGFDTFQPVFIDADNQVPRPLFVGYLFVQFDAANPTWRDIPHLRASGVRRLFSASAERPIPMRLGVVEYWIDKAATDGGVIDARPVAPSPIEVGTQVRVVSGPLSDMTGLCRSSTADRVEIMLGGFAVRLSRSMVQAEA